MEPAQFVQIPEAPVPEGGEASWIKGHDGALLRAALFTPKGRARGSIVLSGGRTEAIEKYFEVVQDFLDRGFVVLTHDWRGQGLSHRMLEDRLKGHADGAKPFLDDFRILLEAYEPQLPRPWTAVGHSMGGCLTLLAMVRGEDRFAGALLCAPMLGVQTGGRSRGAVRSLVAISKLLGRRRRYVLGDPGKPFDEAFENNVLTHDARRYARACALLKAEPQLALGAPTWGWLDFALTATAELARPERLARVTAPVVIVSAEDDKLVDNAAQQAAARHLPQGKFVSVPGAYHEILMESDEMRNILMRAFDALTGRVAPRPAEPAATAPTHPAPAPAPAMPAATPAAAPMTVAQAASAPPAPAVRPAAAKPTAKRGGKPATGNAAPKKTAKPAAKATPKSAATPAKAAAKAKSAKSAKPAATKKAPVARTPAGKASTAKPAAAAKKAPAAKRPAARKSATRKTPAK